MCPVLRLLAAIGDRLLSTTVPAPRPALGPPPYDIPEFDWRTACRAVASRTGAPLADAERGLTDALNILDVLIGADDIVNAVTSARAAYEIYGD